MSIVDLDRVMRALAAVPAPDNSPSLATSPALSAIAIEGSKISFAILVDSQQAASLEVIRKAAETAVRTVPGVSDVMVVLTADKPVSAKIQHAAQRGQGIPGVQHIIAVASGKGGVGKSTIAANLALALSAQGLRVGLLDADIYGPSIPTLFNVSSRPRTSAKQIHPLDVLGIRLMSIGFLVPADTAMIWRGPMVISALTQLLRDVIWGDLDVLMVDMPPGTGDAQLTLAQHVPLAGAVIVSTPQDLALADARRGIAMFGKVGVPILGIVENMSYYCCAECGHRADIFGHGGAQEEAMRLNVPFLGEIPLDGKIREMSDLGTPIVAAEPCSPQALAFSMIAAALMQNLEHIIPQKAPDIVTED
jgi:ATP-binding protein involved in chromosome partitioning